MKIIGLIAFILIFLSSVFAQEARRVDEFGLVGCNDWKSRIQNFAEGIRLSQNLKAYIIYYGGRFYPFYYQSGEIVQRLARRNEAKARVEYFKFGSPGVAFDKDVIFLFGGYQEKFKVEFWLVSDTEKLPKLQPTIKPEKMKFRKGKVTKKELDELCAF